MAFPHEDADEGFSVNNEYSQNVAEPHANHSSPHNLLSITAELESLLQHTQFPLETPDAPTARGMLKQAQKQIADYVKPRLASQEAPLLAVVGGSTGAGKSTLINSLLGERATLPGALRPTTRIPVLVHHPENKQWFEGNRILPSFLRESAGENENTTQGSLPPEPTPQTNHNQLRLVSSSSLPQGLAFIDSPDVDSMVDSNRELAQQLLNAGDLWIFLTTAARYADAVPWDALKQAAARHTQIAIVLDRVDPTAMEVVPDLRAMLDRHDLQHAPLFVIEEQPLQDGFLPAEAVAHIREWLAWLMLSPGERDKVVAGTQSGAVQALARTVEELAVFSETQIRALQSLQDIADDSYGAALKKILEQTSDGSMLRGEVLNRWQDYIGTGEFMRGVEEKISAARDKISAYFRGKKVAPKVQHAVGDSLFAIVKNQCDEAAEKTFSAWHSSAPGTAFTHDSSLMMSSSGLADSLAFEIRQWQSAVLALVSEQGASKRSTARTLALGTNGLGVALMVVVFTATGGLTGAEVGIAGGTAVVAQKLLESVFGEDAVRRLAVQAQEDLNARVNKLVLQEKDRFISQLADLGVDNAQPTNLHSIARSLQKGLKQQGASSFNSVSTDLGEPGATAASKWFAGSIDSEHVGRLGTDFYYGAILLGTAGTAVLESEELTGVDTEAGGSAPKWWRKLFSKGTDR